MLPSNPARRSTGVGGVRWRLLSRSSRETPAAGSSERDAELVVKIRAGEERAFVELVSTYQPMMLRIARSHVASAAVAEEVVQDTWIAVLKGLDGFAGRSSVRTWIFQILINRARSTGTREHRSAAIAEIEPAVDASRFDASGAWMAPPQHWIEDAEERLDASVLAGPIETELARLPARQREVVLLRDVGEFSSEEVCAVLELSEGNQRVLLHRGRSRLREAVEAQVGGG
jgi:RNA polymerase sigma-70 factor, ECF subfamily